MILTSLAKKQRSKLKLVKLSLSLWFRSVKAPLPASVNEFNYSFNPSGVLM